MLVTMAAGLAAITSNITEELGVLSYIGMSLWLFGFAVEVTADAQKRRFKALPENKGCFIKSGLWAWSQHPNYFGDATIWFSFGLFSIASGGYWHFIGALVMIYLIGSVTTILLCAILFKCSLTQNSNKLKSIIF